ncbi:uncharacterized protein I303_104504 [Kwoniella dejecticola CBS 10117]|uniref:Uncharacterized protein n=1 Tax=Kwoniella dejecticola CBS 10117 TaxID=1296121 RepID=A0A1A6A560_9TREE|nr:uncharacterized protein I303_04518 [Kwoniella dejecticola CBS 10117]OBR85186.1 hypothetical protein I303_04518 [Kwoniella dejecticola CBS 10117]
MLEYLPGVSLPADGSICLASWLDIMVKGTIAILVMNLFTLIYLTAREGVLIHRARRDKAQEQEEVTKAEEKLGIL